MAEPLGASRAALARDRARRRMPHAVALAFLAATLLFALVAWMEGDSFYLRLASEALIFSGLAVSVDVLLGYTGLLSLGQALYFGLGAYVSALVLKDVAPSFWLALGAALAAGTALGLIGGLIANRVSGIYFALITFGMAQVAAKVVYNIPALGASDGIIGIPTISANFVLFTVRSESPAGFFLVVLGATTVLYLGLSYLMGTPFGRTLQAIRANQDRVAFLGYNLMLYKVLAFVLAADVAAVAGAFYPMLRGFVSPELLYFETSGNAVIMALIGGVGTLIGPILGSALLTALRSVLGSYTEHHLIVIGILFMLAVLFMPRGLVGLARPWIGRRAAARAPAP
jgi:branched-chain amino acid transport system permease protein